MKKNSFKKSKGITLIALVITIIIMLILVGVTISLSVNGGLFGYSGNVVRDTKVAIDYEQNLGNLETGLTTDELIEKFTSTPNIHSWTRRGDTFICSHCNKSYTMGEVVTYTPNTGKTETMVSGRDNGYDEDQTISRLSSTWVVLGLDKNGVLLITTSEPTGSILKIGGAKAYTMGPSIMNRVCEELYSNTTYGKARSINIDDVNIALNWTDTRGIVCGKDRTEYKVMQGTKFGDIGTNKMKEEDWNAIKNNNQTPETNKELTDYEIDGYAYNIEDVENITEAEEQIIFGPLGVNRPRSWAIFTPI